MMQTELVEGAGGSRAESGTLSRRCACPESSGGTGGRSCR